MASKTSGRRRTTPQKKKAASGKAAAKRKEENAFIRDEIKLLVLFAVSILLLISNFGLGGAAGAFVSGIMFGLFGVSRFAIDANPLMVGGLTLGLALVFLIAAYASARKVRRVDVRELVAE